MSDEPTAPAMVFRGAKSLCREYSLVLDSKSLDHDLVQIDGQWVITVAPVLLQPAREELDRYAAERSFTRAVVHVPAPYPGASLGVIVYSAVLLLTAYAAGIGLWGKDWLARGALDATAPSRSEWWRAITALTLHADQQHLLSNLLFGILIGLAASRLMGPGVAWALALCSAVAANVLEMLVSPSAHRAIGASTAVFSLLGLITGLAWAKKLKLRERHWYRWAPVIVGVTLLAFFGGGAGDDTVRSGHEINVDVLGHVLGFTCGVSFGWLYAQTSLPRNRSKAMQIAAGFGAVLTVSVAWIAALKS